MKILHTSDWHLGHHLLNKSRTEEHVRFLKWLLNQLVEKNIDVLIIAGDIFDTSYPPNFALQQYYNFLIKISKTPCSNVVIVGGNHDGPSTLNAPRDILSHFNISVVGGAESNPAQEVKVLKDNNNKIIGIICAVPFLRTRDIKKAVAGQSYEENEKAITQGIINHYSIVREKAVNLKQELGENIPVIATGHLFAAGGKVSDSEREIHVGSLGKVGGESFSYGFDYVALGHLHNAQLVNKNEHIRYSGSPIPLSFSETGSEKSVIVAEFNHTLTKIEPVTIPCFRKLERFKGNLESIASQLQSYNDNILFSKTQKSFLTPWAEVRVETESFDPTIQDKVMKMVQGEALDILIVKTDKNAQKKIWNLDNNDSLDELHPEDVFIKRCELEGLEGNDKEEMINAFNELRMECEV